MTVVVALFVGAIALLGTWLLLSSDPTVSPSAGRPGDETQGVSSHEGEEGGTTRLEMRRRPIPPGDLERGSTVEELRLRGINVDRITAPVSGSQFTVDSDGVAAAVTSRRAGLDSCYGTAVLHTPDLPAAQSFTVRIEPNPGQTWGTITSVQAAGAAHGTVLETCALDVLGQVRFRDVAGPTTLTVPVTLTRP
jgi:hypothetical protein